MLRQRSEQNGRKALSETHGTGLPQAGQLTMRGAAGCVTIRRRQDPQAHRSRLVRDYVDGLEQDRPGVPATLRAQSQSGGVPVGLAQAPCAGEQLPRFHGRALGHGARKARIRAATRDARRHILETGQVVLMSRDCEILSSSGQLKAGRANVKGMRLARMPVSSDLRRPSAVPLGQQEQLVMILAHALALGVARQVGMQAARDAHEETAAESRFIGQGRRRRDRLAGGLGGLDPCGDGIVRLLDCLGFGGAPGRAAGQIGDNDDEALVFVAPKDFNRVFRRLPRHSVQSSVQLARLTGRKLPTAILEIQQFGFVGRADRRYRLQNVRLKNGGMPVLARRFVFMFPPGYLSSYPLYWRCS